MCVELIKVDYGSISHCEIIAKLLREQEFRDRMVCTGEHDVCQAPSVYELHKKTDRAPINRFSSEYIVRDHAGNYLGLAGIEFDPSHKSIHGRTTAWIDLGISEVKDRHRGIGSEVLSKLEEISRGAGAECAEVGVFEFNKEAVSFFKKHGYAETTRFCSGTWKDGRWWDDIRFVKIFPSAPFITC